MPKRKPLTIVFASAEIAPFSKTGGLGDVAGSLPPAIQEQGQSLHVFTPLHYVTDVKKHGLKRIKWRLPITIGDKKLFFNIWQGKLNNNVPVYFIDHYDLFRKRHNLYGYPKDGNYRYYFFNKAILEAVKILKIKPRVIHCHDWHVGLIPNLIHSQEYGSYFSNTATVITIHNILFQQAVHSQSLYQKDNGLGLPKETIREIKKLNFLLRGILNADAISTVSQQYAEEIQTPAFGNGLEEHLYRRRKRLFGILNGIDYNHFDPRHDEHIAHKYHLSDLYKKRRNKSFLQDKLGLDVDDNVPIIGMATRITEQKGFELLFDIIDQLMTMHLQIAIVGSGDDEYEKLIAKYNKKYPKKIGVHLEFSESVASHIYAGSDMFLMPSRFEPCGLGQMIALRFGTIPIVHKVGGLAETIKDYNPSRKTGNGFTFTHYTSMDMLSAIIRALETFKYRDRWDKLMRSSMKQSYSWELPAEQYIKLYRFAISKRRKYPVVKFHPDKKLTAKLQS